jgi:hypothetical protein
LTTFKFAKKEEPFDCQGFKIQAVLDFTCLLFKPDFSPCEMQDCSVRDSAASRRLHQGRIQGF